MDLKQTIETAIQASLRLQQSQYEIKSARADKDSRRTTFFPLLNVKYDYIRRDEPTLQSLIFGANENTERSAVINPLDEFQFVSSFSQPVFTGFELINRYRIADIKLRLAEFSKEIVRHDVILDAVNTYFSVLKFRKLVNVARDTLDQIRSQKEVASNMYQAGLISITDLLQSEVELSRAKQDIVKSQNNLKTAQFRYNTLLRRPLISLVDIVDVTDYVPFRFDLEYCRSNAQQNRIEIKMADQEIALAEKEYALARKDLYPSIDLIGTLTRRGTDLSVDGGEGIGDENIWSIRVSASWKFWDWGRTTYKTNGTLSRMAKAESLKQQIMDDISLEIQESYLAMMETESGISTAKTAIDQAGENFRITKEKYAKQVVTMTEFLSAQALLTETLTAYYNALYDFKVAKAILYRAIGENDPEEYVQSLTAVAHTQGKLKGIKR